MAKESNFTAMRSLALGLRKDLDEVRAGLTQEWSNGSVEGFVHRSIGHPVSVCLH